MFRAVRRATAALAILWVAALHAGSSSAVSPDAGSNDAGSAGAGSSHPVEDDGDAICAPARLSETGLYADGRPGAVDPRNRPFSPQYPLWSDAAAKSRWIFLPPGSSIDTRDPGNWEMPVGTKFWKQFTFNGRAVETRLLWRASAGRWIFATYVWNEEGTDALLAPDAGVPGAVELAPGKRHDIPGVADCRACHGEKRPGPLGFNALQLSTDRDPNAIHGEPLAPGMTTIATLDREGLLSPARPDLVAHPPRIATRDPETRAVLGYFAGNCGSCHNRSGEIAYDGPSLKHSDVLDGDAVASALLAKATTWQVPGQPEGASVMLSRAHPEASAMLARMKSRRPSSQMPPLGTVIRDDRAIAALERWLARDQVHNSVTSNSQPTPKAEVPKLPR